MTRLSRTSVEIKKRIVAVITVWLEMCSVVSWLLSSMMSASSLSICMDRFPFKFYDEIQDIRTMQQDLEDRFSRL